jgi:hypothetical protein
VIGVAILELRGEGKFSCKLRDGPSLLIAKPDTALNPLELAREGRVVLDFVDRDHPSQAGYPSPAPVFVHRFPVDRMDAAPDLAVEIDDGDDPISFRPLPDDLSITALGVFEAVEPLAVGCRLDARFGFEAGSFCQPCPDLIGKRGSREIANVSM